MVELMLDHQNRHLYIWGYRSGKIAILAEVKRRLAERASRETPSCVEQNVGDNP